MSYTAEVTEVTYTDHAHNSDKYYRCYLLSSEDSTDHRVVFQWGRRGSKGQSQNSVTASRGEAERMVRAKLSSKTSKGYVESYHKELPGVSNDILDLAGVNRFGVQTEVASADPFVRISLDVDEARRLAMGDEADVVKAITLRRGLLDSLDSLRTSVARAEGEVEIVDMILSAKVG